MIFLPGFSFGDSGWDQQNLSQLLQRLSFLGFFLSGGDQAEAEQRHGLETFYIRDTT
jgi:hypothetical protein